MKKNSIEAGAARWPQGEVMQEIDRLTGGEAKAALAMAVHVMERTLECACCPSRKDCGEDPGIGDCEKRVLSELIEKCDAASGKEAG